ncbi:MAG: helix-turn-helix domain-containing GNAT family N-acetyltransferase [Bryobacteraceae bacterium]
MAATAEALRGMGDQTAAFRRFSRFYTRTIGALQEGLLNSPYALTEARVLYELATRKETTAKEIAGELNLDAGYLSRILRKFEESSLMKRATSQQDARQALLTLTKRGRAAFADLNECSEREVRKILDNLPPAKRSELIRSMRTVEGILANQGQNRAPFILRQYRPGDMGWVIEKHGELYAQEYGWDDSFEALVARIVADFITDYDPKRERCWIAERDGDRLGCIFLVKHPDESDVAKLRLLLVERNARGLGLGKTLVGECVKFARTAGYRKVTLWTQSILAAAHRIYQQAGFRLVHEEPHHSFGKELVGQTLELEL